MNDVSVYVVTNLGSFRSKIGISSNPSVRLASMQTGSPEELYLVWTSRPVSRAAAAYAERQAHKALAKWRLHGEWFDLPYDLCVEPIEIALQGGPR